MKEFLEYIVTHLVDHPEQIVIVEEHHNATVSLRLSVGEGEVGKVIGRSGRTAQALRVLLSAVAARQGKRALLEIVD